MLCNGITDTAGLLRWEVWRAKPSKKHLVLHLVRAALPPEPGAKHKRLGGLWPPYPHLASLPAVSSLSLQFYHLGFRGTTRRRSRRVVPPKPSLGRSRRGRRPSWTSPTGVGSEYTIRKRFYDATQNLHHPPHPPNGARHCGGGVRLRDLG